MRQRRARLWGALGIALLVLAALAFWQRQALARFAITSAIGAFAHVRVAAKSFEVGPTRTVLQGVTLTSSRGEPVGTIGRLEVTYDLRDLLPGGTRLFGLQSVAIDSPHVVIIRRPDGSYNIPIPRLPSGKGAARPPLIARVQLRNGSIEIVNESPHAVPGLAHMYVRDAQADADISTAGRSYYTASLMYGEHPNRIYPVRGRGLIDVPAGTIDQRWSAGALPIAAAVDFALNSATLSVRTGMVRNVDARYFSIPHARGASAQFSTTARLDGTRLAISGLSAPIEGVHGPIDVDRDAIVTPGLDANLAGIPAHVTGGVFGFTNPRLRIAVTGNGESAKLSSAIAQARRFPIRGSLAFSLLVQGAPANPLTWIAVRSPRMTYAATTIDGLAGLVAFAGKEADVIGMHARYGGVRLSARGRVAFQKQPHAIEMLVGAAAPPGGTPYLSNELPLLPVNAVVLAMADDPKAIAMRGALWGNGGAQRLDALFDIDQRGVGTIGPVQLRSGPGSLYARIALDRPRDRTLGLLDVRDFPLPRAYGSVDATLFGTQTRAGITLGGGGRVSDSLGIINAHGQIAVRREVLRGSIVGDAGAQGNFGAIVGGTPRSPQIAGTIVVSGARYRNFTINGDAGLAFADGTLDVHDTAVAVGPLFVGIAGTVAGLSLQRGITPTYDLATTLQSSNVGALLAALQPRAAGLMQGSIDANLRVKGSGVRASFAGHVSAPEGLVNGLAFRDFYGDVSGSMDAIALRGGHATVSSTDLALAASATPGSASFGVRAPRADLADFNDFFNTGDTFAGTGSLAMNASLRGTHLVTTSGDAHFAGARFRRLDLGKVDARWNEVAGAVDTALSFGGPSGSLALRGSVQPAPKQVDLRATARSVDLGTWLPMLGITAPITGRLDATTTLAGRYPDLDMTLRAALHGGTAGRLPIERFDVTASASGGIARIESAALELPYLTTTASGTFGLRPNDPLALVARSTSSNVGAFMNAATGKAFPLSGTLDSTLQLIGTRNSPRIRDSLAMTSVRYGNLTIPGIAGDLDADRHAIAIRNGVVDLVHGRALISARIPLLYGRAAAKLGAGPISATLSAQDVELSNFATILPKGSQLSGRIDGSVAASNTLAAPELSGALELRNGAFSGPFEKTPITAINGDLRFARSQAQLQARAAMGGGTAALQGAATVADLRRFAASPFMVAFRAENAKLDLPDYFAGALTGTVSLSNTPAGPVMSGDVSVNDARIPFSGLLAQKSGASPNPFLSRIAFDRLRLAIGSNVRVQSANVDVGMAGGITMSGTLAHPALAGAIRSTGGSLSFYRNFNLERGLVSFSPSAGVIPDVDAVASTFVANPATAISLHVTGPVTNMNLALASEPPYTRQQILGILIGAQQLGAVQGVAATGGQPFSATSTVANLALGQVNTVFTRNMLEPLSTSVASALGFTSVQITSDLQTGLGVNAVKAFGKNVSAIFSQTFGYPKVQSVTLEAHPNVATGLRLTAFTAEGPTLLALQQPQPVAAGALNLNPLTSFEPVSGTNGFSLSYQRKFP
jgi:hypothetical protein